MFMAQNFIAAFRGVGKRFKWRETDVNPMAKMTRVARTRRKFDVLKVAFTHKVLSASRPGRIVLMATTGTMIEDKSC